MSLNVYRKDNSLGLHIILDYWGCDHDTLNNPKIIEDMCLEALKLAKATIIKSVFHQFSPQGVTGVVVIAESHLSVHTWPENGFAALDIFTCSETMHLDLLVSHLETVLTPKKKLVQQLIRGDKIVLP